MTSLTKLGAVAVSLLLLACVARGSLITDPHGMNGGSPGQWQNTIRFPTSPQALVVDVEYCVYAPGDFSLSFPTWTDPTGGSEYVYAYQVFNTVTRSYSPKAPVWRFSVGLNGPHEEQAANIGCVIDDPNHKSPTSTVLTLATARWNFDDPNDIEYGYVSNLLVYTSPFSPEMDSGTVGGPAPYSKTINPSVPSPAPEPATAGLLGAGLFLLARSKRARRIT